MLSIAPVAPRFALLPVASRPALGGDGGVGGGAGAGGGAGGAVMSEREIFQLLNEHLVNGSAYYAQQ